MLLRLIASLLGTEASRSSIRVLLASGAAAALGVIAQIAAARMLGPTAFGSFAFAVTTLLLGSGLAKLGFDTSTLRFVPAYLATGQLNKLRGFSHMSTAAVLGASSAIGALFVVWSAYGYPDHLGLRQSLALVGITLPVVAWLELLGARMQAVGQVVALQIVSGVVRPLLFLLLLSVYVHSSAPTNELVGIAFYLVSLFAAGLAVQHLLSRRVPQFGGIPESTPSEWLRVSLPLYAVSVSQLVLLRIDTLIVGTLVDVPTAGIYWAASQLAAIVSFGISSINGLTAPRISESYARKDMRALLQLLRDSSRVVASYTLPVLVVLVLLGDRILHLFGPDFRQAYAILVILALGHTVTAFLGPVGFLLTMTSHHLVAMWTICAAAMLNVVLCVALGTHYGLLGIAIGTAIATALRSVLLTYFVRTKLELRWPAPFWRAD